MRVHYKMYYDGVYDGAYSEKELTEAQARERIEELWHNPRCGWAEIVDTDDLTYYIVIDKFNRIRAAKSASRLLADAQRKADIGMLF